MSRWQLITKTSLKRLKCPSGMGAQAIRKYLCHKKKLIHNKPKHIHTHKQSNQQLEENCFEKHFEVHCFQYALTNIHTIYIEKTLTSMMRQKYTLWAPTQMQKAFGCICVCGCVQWPMWKLMSYASCRLSNACHCTYTYKCVWNFMIFVLKEVLLLVLFRAHYYSNTFWFPLWFSIIFGVFIISFVWYHEIVSEFIYVYVCIST